LYALMMDCQLARAAWPAQPWAGFLPRPRGPDAPRSRHGDGWCGVSAVPALPAMSHPADNATSRRGPLGSISPLGGGEHSPCWAGGGGAFDDSGNGGWWRSGGGVPDRRPARTSRGRGQAPRHPETQKKCRGSRGGGGLAGVTEVEEISGNGAPHSGRKNGGRRELGLLIGDEGRGGAPEGETAPPPPPGVSDAATRGDGTYHGHKAGESRG
jgi:hypothetical protein